MRFELIVPFTSQKLHLIKLNAVKAGAHTFTKELKYSKLHPDLSALQLTVLQ
jgi:hypothetical protein